MGGSLRKEAPRLGRLEKGEGERGGGAGPRCEEMQMCAVELGESSSWLERPQKRSDLLRNLGPNSYDPHFLPFIRVTVKEP